MNKLRRFNYSLILGVFFVTVMLFFASFGSFLAPHSITETLEPHYHKGTMLAPPLEPFKNQNYPFGTDRWGYDLFSMILNGLKYTVFISLAVTIIKMLIGSIAGLYIGIWKKTPGWMIAFENAWSYIPLFLILYFFLNPISFNSPLSTATLVGYFILIASMVSIPSIISSVRQKSSQLYSSMYVESAKALGASKHRIIWKHIFPQIKESLLIMFVLEIVYVMTMMGQLALINIFIGGTRMVYDPILYHSITNELAGLVGQARQNIYGNTYILMIPLTILLFTTVSFTLLANGLKNRFQSNYQRTPWIKTGQDPHIKPIRKKFGDQRKWWKLTGGKWGLLLLLISFISAGSYVVAAKDSNIGVKNGSLANYNLQLNMTKNGTFNVVAAIEVKNKSDNNWNDLEFYFIPNVFKKGHHLDGVEGFSTVDIKQVKWNGKNVPYSLKKDTFKISLANQLEKGKKGSVKITYSFTVPEEGSRFSKIDENYYLAQWYPMLATYQQHHWNKEDYLDGLETYHTDFSNFHVSYKLPKGYSFISSADQDPSMKRNEGTVTLKNVREFFIAAVKDMNVYEKEARNGVTVRLFTKNDHNKDPKAALNLAVNALSFYQEKIGEYPLRQFDIIMDKGEFMEYPGIVTIDPYIKDERFYQESIVHETAHQYFYGVVSNDPYHEAWLDEGMTEFATDMYYYVAKNQLEDQAFGMSIYRMEKIKQRGLYNQASNVSLNKNKDVGYIYGQPALALFKMINERYQLKGSNVKDVGMQYLSDYYNEFKYKEVNTSEFIRFTKNYFQVPTAYFEEWLDVDKK
ncbi:ABC transporter permease subunit [Bacillus sp. 03113]|uniref:ABC transporter permease subunit n=1 Tax=Bacillus sp. 03113 TaxID=2578211 RepID=UPI0011439D06|nr:ABC transporter permease subunit [Bacillus sp. 03113]